VAVTYGDVITDAFYELSILGAGEVLSPEDADLGLGKLNRLIDNWNGERQAVYHDALSSFTLTPSLSPHTIGPSGATWTLSPNRPVSIARANLVINGTRIKIDVHNNDVGWYAGLALPALSGDPTDVYYEADWPNGKLYFYPVPSSAYSVELWARVELAAVAAADNFSLPPGYRDALTLTLAESLGPAYPNAVVSADLKANATHARARIFANNDVTPHIATRDGGMPRSGPRGSFNYKTGLVS
jgi:hypothetical protein